LSPENKIGPLNTGPPPPELRAALMPAVPVIVDAAIAAIGVREPSLRTSERALEHNLRRGLTDAVDRWFDGPREATAGDLHFGLGRAQARAGRSLEELMGFYRLAAQTMWRRLTEVGAEHGIAPEHLYRLAETGFGTVEQISTQAAEGFTEEQAHRSIASRSRRGELVRLVLSEPQPDAGALAAAATEVGVELTADLAVFAGPSDGYEPFLRAAREQLVMGPRDGRFDGLLLDPEGPARRAGLRAACERAGVQVALGPPVALAAARRSAERAAALLGLAAAGHVSGGALLDTREHASELLLSADPVLAAEVAAGALAPLSQVPGAATRENLLLTLREWLRNPRQRKAIAHTLGVHPQTVRYRMLRLRELFGEALDDADRRFELELALRVRPYADEGAGRDADGPAAR
jgi:hypothetical protein